MLLNGELILWPIVPLLVVVHDRYDAVIDVVVGLHAILEGVFRVLEHRDPYLSLGGVEEGTKLVRDIVLCQSLLGHGVTIHLDPLLDDDGLAMFHPRVEHVLLSDVHIHGMLHHCSDAIHFRHEPLLFSVPPILVG